MRVYFVNSVLDYGSTGKIVRDLSNELIKDNHEVRMAFGRHSAKDTKNTLDLNNKRGFIVHAIMSRFFGRHGLHSTKETKILINDIKAFKPDVIHIHNLHGYYLNVPMFLKEVKKMNVKIIYTLHDTWLVSGSSAYFDYGGCAVWDEGCVVNNNTSNYPEASFIKRQRKNFAWKKEVFKGFNDLTFISPSEWLKGIIQDTFLKEYTCEVVNNGIDTSVFYEHVDSKLNDKYKDKKVLLGVSSIWEARKGLDDLIALNKLLSDEYQMVIVGLTEKQISDLPEGIEGIARTNNAGELAEYYSVAHAFLNPTYEDNYPTTNLEARACNSHVVAYDTGGNKEVEGVIIVPQGDIMAMKDAIESIKDNHLENKVDYSKEKFVEEMMKYY